MSPDRKYSLINSPYSNSENIPPTPKEVDLSNGLFDELFNYEDPTGKTSNYLTDYEKIASQFNEKNIEQQQFMSRFLKFILEESPNAVYIVKALQHSSMLTMQQKDSNDLLASPQYNSLQFLVGKIDAYLSSGVVKGNRLHDASLMNIDDYFDEMQSLSTDYLQNSIYLKKRYRLNPKNYKLPHTELNISTFFAQVAKDAPYILTYPIAAFGKNVPRDEIYQEHIKKGDYVSDLILEMEQPFINGQTIDLLGLPNKIQQFLEEGKKDEVLSHLLRNPFGQQLKQLLRSTRTSDFIQNGYKLLGLADKNDFFQQQLITTFLLTPIPHEELIRIMDDFSVDTSASTTDEPNALHIDEAMNPLIGNITLFQMHLAEQLLLPAFKPETRKESFDKQFVKTLNSLSDNHVQLLVSDVIRTLRYSPTLMRRLKPNVSTEEFNESYPLIYLLTGQNKDYDGARDPVYKNYSLVTYHKTLPHIIDNLKLRFGKSKQIDSLIEEMLRFDISQSVITMLTDAMNLQTVENQAIVNETPDITNTQFNEIAAYINTIPNSSDGPIYISNFSAFNVNSFMIDMFPGIADIRFIIGVDSPTIRGNIFAHLNKSGEIQIISPCFDDPHADMKLIIENIVRGIVTEYHQRLQSEILPGQAEDANNFFDNLTPKS